MRMKFLRILPETCARTWCLFSSWTRNIAFGSGSITVAIPTMASSCEFPESFFFLSSSGLAISSRKLPLLQNLRTNPPPKKLPGRAGHILGPRENQRAVRGDRDGVLEMRRRTAIGGFRYPLIPHANFVAPGIDHRFDRDDHAFLQPRAASRFAVVREVRLVMHLGADAVPHELPYDRKPVLLDQTLHRVANVAEAVAGAHLVDGAVQRVAGYIQQLLQFRLNFADRNGYR